jgi:hypothetical protein
VKYYLDPGYLMRTSPEMLIKYSDFRETDKQFNERIDEILNLCANWRSLDDIWDWVCLEFGSFDPKVFRVIIDDLKKTRVIETREV